MILPDAVIDDVRERAAVCVLPDDPQTAMLLVVREFGYACGEAVDAHCYDAHPRKDDLRRAAVDVAAAALVMVARLDGGEWDDGLNATGESETMPT